MSSQASDAIESLHSTDDRRARACAELRRGAPIILETGSSEAWLALSAEMLRPEIWKIVQKMPSGAWRLAVSDRRAKTLNARAYDGDLARIILRDDLSATQIRAIADPAVDLEHPLLGPHVTDREGSADAHRAAIILCKRARLLPAVLVAPLPESAPEFAARHELARLTQHDALAADPGEWREIVGARVPIPLAQSAQLKIFRRSGWGEEHYAFEIGEPSRAEPVLARLHSACATGDIFGSLKCDCGPQLHAALRQMAEQGAGVLIYLLQEGRGIGLENKMRAYRLQDQGYDTVEANHRLGFQDDERLLSDGAEILRAMGFKSVRLMTNNPKKLDALTEAGLEVTERTPLIVGLGPENARYLEVKAEKSGHLL